MIIAIGEILFDIFPHYRRLGGAPFNFAYHLKNLGLPVRFFTRVGRDPEGEEILKVLSNQGFSMDDVQVDDDRPTGTVTVELDEEGSPNFDITADVAYDHIEMNRWMEKALRNDVDLIYFGTLVQRNESGFRTIQSVLSKRSRRTLGLYDINLRPNCYSKQAVLNSLIRSDIVKLNREELSLLQDMFDSQDDSKAFLRKLMITHALKIVSLTKGDAGSELFTRNGHFTAPAKKPRKIADTVGAGDAYTAVLAAGYLQGWKPEKILKNASEFAASVCEIEGAMPSDNSFYLDRLKKEL